MDSFEMPYHPRIKLRAVRLNPLTLDPGALVFMGARSLSVAELEKGNRIMTFPLRLEVQVDHGPWEPVEFTNEVV